MKNSKATANGKPRAAASSAPDVRPDRHHHTPPCSTVSANSSPKTPSTSAISRGAPTPTPTAPPPMSPIKSSPSSPPTRSNASKPSAISSSTSTTRAASIRQPSTPSPSFSASQRILKPRTATKSSPFSPPSPAAALGTMLTSTSPCSRTKPRPRNTRPSSTRSSTTSPRREPRPSPVSPPLLNFLPTPTPTSATPPPMPSPHSALKQHPP